MGQTSKIMEIQERRIDFSSSLCVGFGCVPNFEMCPYRDTCTGEKKIPMDPPNGRCHHETVHFEGSINVTRAYHTG
jgi:hypothetical protein